MDDKEKLFAAILEKDFAAADKMLAAGVTLDGDIRDALVKGPTGAANFVLARYNYHKQFMAFAEKASAEDFAEVAEKLFGLVGEPLFNNIGEYRYSSNFCNKFYNPVFFEAILKYFNGKQMRKQMTMQEIIDNNSTELLALCAKYGWLKMPRIRDAMIEYSREKQRTECTAFLLDFKNRTADLKAERERTEKRMQRELNASPTSIAEMKKVWRFKKLEDGTLEITSYKGKQAEVVVPEKIGKDTVTSIGNTALSGSWYFAKRTPHEVCDFRESGITKITLPDMITKIGEYAFNCCRALKEINIPNGVKVIENGALSQTAIEALELPETVERLGDYAFSQTFLKEIKLPQSLAEIGKNAFQLCELLERIEIPARVKKISPWTFWRCDKLREVVLPEGIEAIKAQAFWDCPELETINLPASIKKIENAKRFGLEETLHAFADSPKLTAIVEKGSYAERYCARNNISFRYKED